MPDSAANISEHHTLSGGYIFMKMIQALIGAALLAIAGCSGNQQTGNDTSAAPEGVAAPSAGTAVVKPGIEVLEAEAFAPLRGKRVGLVTNPTGIDNSMRSTIDILASAPEVKLTALFAPEHGVRGDHVAGETVSNSVDKATGVQVYSLHGRTKKPTAEMLRNVDVIVYDIQDIGCRSYTFISTMGLCMEAAAANGKEFMVLDRPDPLGGNKVEGNILEKGRESFVGRFNIPYVYGLTPGELASWLKGEGMISGAASLKLTVIPMEGWRRDMTFDRTGMPWVLPSPQIPTPATAFLYPATGIMGELDYVSIGVGYTLPFGLTAAPWIDAQELAARLTSLGIPGVEFRPLHYKPYFGIFSGRNIGGVQIYITDPAAAPLTLLQFYIMQELATLYPDHKAFASATAQRLKMFDMVCGSSTPRELFGKNYRVDDLRPFWEKDVDSFKASTAKYHLYE